MYTNQCIICIICTPRMNINVWLISKARLDSNRVSGRSAWRDPDIADGASPSWTSCGRYPSYCSIGGDESVPGAASSGLEAPETRRILGIGAIRRGFPHDRWRSSGGAEVSSPSLQYPAEPILLRMPLERQWSLKSCVRYSEMSNEGKHHNITN